jgi:3,4-dihydroxy 2-butanone 4-phosphate synthase/GTP cyclohydrolase II
MDEVQPRTVSSSRGGKTPATGGSRPDYHQDEWFDRLPDLSGKFLDRHHRPLVTVSYAQSVDGSIATRNHQQLRLSSHQSMVLTHRIRAACDAIVIGINTLLVDNPLLTVRLIEGPNPQPIVLDSKLRIPLRARLLDRTDHRCWLACTDKSDLERIGTVERRGAELIHCRRDRLGRVDLPNLLSLLGQKGIRSVMVEGGSQVITSFLEARLVDQVIITIAPRLVGGLPVLNRPTAGNGSLVHLDPVSYQSCGPDIILWGRPRWREP